MIRVERTTSTPFQAFADRHDAGRRLALFLNPEPDSNALVLAVPRGGIPVAAPLADALGADLRPVPVRKLPIPSSPEAGFGALTVDGGMVLNEELLKQIHIPGQAVERVAGEVKKELLRRSREYGGGFRPSNVRDRDVYIVDDGLASGYTMLAAARMARRNRPRLLVLAVPVSPRDSLLKTEPYFDEVHCLIEQERPPFAVASFYENFADLSDNEVREVLQRFD